ncbi:2-hydroxyacid dehydrogenase [Acidithiobacillus sp. CV18-2]|nr:2-hydroxyacid dehydrogenase [Acidithiobacillus sp. CV18-3]MBU2756135.1 2-hydroxyacid dehydrogenase [Acidithiobacillus sp. BN09-2]MBU2777860.1 2-hydroxyacid dehydrogenase [Acidithiobacillus sp. CV18-2]MBU2798055.1 2-hydroxyacid dehydrogenase [Acidithiobacillus sp. VAN18-4]UTV82099.1 2-hydroxyacid dehydrogenase [Acidithiobacillus sp. YTS05]
MRCLVTSSRPYDQEYLNAANNGRHELIFTDVTLNAKTAFVAQGFPAVCPFVDDRLDQEALHILAKLGIELLALRSTGYNHVHIATATQLGMTVMRVREYSPYAVAEFALALMLTLNRKVHKAYNRVREGNLLLDGLLGFDMHGKTIGIIGTGKIGLALARILHGMGCRLLGYDISPNPAAQELGMLYLPLEELLQQSQIVSLHLPLLPETQHLLNAERLALLPKGAMLINTSRGGLIDTAALIGALKSRRLGAVGLDVYEEEAELYFRDHCDDIICDDTFERLLTFPNVIVTGHQSFFTREALQTIAATTIENLTDYCEGRSNHNIVST